MKSKQDKHVGMWASFYSLIAFGLVLAMVSSPLSPVGEASSAPLQDKVNMASVVNLTINPYADVDWATYSQYKANFHTHSTYSDGGVAFSTVVNAYNTANYDILAMTDHNVVTWPWTGGIPAGMLAVRGDEYSGTSPYEHHTNVFYNFTRVSATLPDGVPHSEGEGGMSHINHPGRYYTPNDWSFYTPWYRNYPSCHGIEVYNQGDRYPTDRQLWDNINQNLMPEKLIWGYSNDDMHLTSHYFHNYQYMLMPSLTESALKESQKSGAFYFVYEPSGNGNPNVPRISNIVVDDVAKTITITATGATATIRWYSQGTTQVATGATFNYGTFTNMNFVRAVLDGANGDSFTQPFGLRTTDNAVPAAASNLDVDWWGRVGTAPNTYTYSGVTQAMSTPNAWFCDSDYPVSTELTTPNSATELTDSGYSQIATSDDVNRAISANPGTDDEIFVKSSFTISQAARDVSSLEMTMEIQSDTASSFSIFAYDFIGAVWKQIGPTSASIAADTDYTVTRSITENVDRYISTTGEVRWGCYQTTSAQLVRVDYARLVVNTQTYSTEFDNCLNWTKSADDGAGANDVVSYSIYRSDLQTGPWDSAHKIASVPAGTAYYYDLAKGKADTTRWWYVIRAQDVSGAEETNTNAIQEPTQTATPPYAISLTGKTASSWVFVSFPSGLTGNIETILNDATSGDGLTTWSVAKWYNGQTKVWASYRATGVQTLTTINNQMGVWLYLTANGGDQVLTLNIYVAPPASAVNINLYAGWNMVGYPSMTPRLGSATLPAQANAVTVWQAATPYIADSTPGAVTMSHGNAYWVRVTADCTWTVQP